MYRYVIIDDEPLIRRGTKKKLEPLSHLLTCCGEASNGAEGLELVRQLQPDIVILDMQMPVMGGVELLPVLADEFSEIALVVISGFQNFDYMKQAISAKVIDYILKPFSKEEIQQTITKIIDSLESKKEQKQIVTSVIQEKEEAFYSLDLKLLYNLLLGYETDASIINSQKLAFINKMHHFVLLALYSQPDQPALPIQNWLDENRYTDLALYLPDSGTPAFQFLILFLPENSEDISIHNRFLSQFLHYFLPWLEHFPRYPMVGISSVHEDLSELHTAYKESRSALDTQWICHSAEDFSFFYQQESAPVLISWEREEEFLFRIESGAEDTVRELIEHLFSYYQTISSCTLQDVKYHCEQLTYQCYRILNYYLHQADDAKPSSTMKAFVNTLFSLEEIKAYYIQFFLNITRMLKKESVYVVGNLIDQIKLYMERNYQKNITQEFIASLFYINRSYLSQLFRKQTDQKFVDYLNQIRIEKAKDLLLHSDRKMYQIAKSVGYDNPKYFFRIFKKKTGLSPEQFREQEKTN